MPPKMRHEHVTDVAADAMNMYVDLQKTFHRSTLQTDDKLERKHFFSRGVGGRLHDAVFALLHFFLRHSPPFFFLS